jgi:hypothetical protein
MPYTFNTGKVSFAILIILASIYSCTPCKPEMTDRTIAYECEQLLKSVLHDSNSYERISFLVSDTIHESEDLRIELNSYPKPELNLTRDDEERSKRIDSLTAEIKRFQSNPAMDSIKLFIFDLDFKAKDNSGITRQAQRTIYYYPNETGRKGWLGKTEPDNLYRQN